MAEKRDPSPDEMIERLRPHLTRERMERIETVVAHRTQTVVTVIEGLINFGNVSAVMRSAEALGFYRFHIIESEATRFKNSPRTSQGAEKWLDVEQWTSPAACATALKKQGYTLVATHLDETSVAIDAIDFTRPTALIFGNEAEGVSADLLALADRHCIIPMAGFVQSFNISVAAAVALYHAYRDRMGRQGFHGDLSDTEKKALIADYYSRSLKHAEEILQRGD
jgi:tRNA (guanosine-2'-O-)-methyltransferase